MVQKQKGDAIMSDKLTKFLGDSIGRTILKLLVASIIVGFVLSLMNLDVLDLIHISVDFVVDIWNLGFAALGRFGEYLVIGGAVVIPVFVLLRIFSRNA